MGTRRASAVGRRQPALGLLLLASGGQMCEPSGSASRSFASGTTRPRRDLARRTPPGNSAQRSVRIPSCMSQGSTQLWAPGSSTETTKV
jgi:hypothetical protein